MWFLCEPMTLLSAELCAAGFQLCTFSRVQAVIWLLQSLLGVILQHKRWRWVTLLPVVLVSPKSVGEEAGP